MQKELNGEFSKLKAKELQDTQLFIDEENKIQDAKDAAEIKRIETNEANRLKTKAQLAELDLANSPDSAQAKVDKINADLELELNALAAGDLKRQVLAQNASNAILKIRDDEAKAKEQIDELEFQNKLANANAIGGVVSGLSALIGQETAAGKGIAVASATIDTISSAASIFKAASKNPITIANPAYPYLMTIPAVLGGIARVKQILAVKVPGAGGGGSAPSISAPSAPIAPKSGTTTLDQNSINNMGNAAQPVRAYMTDTDAVSNRERNERLNRAARIGG